MVSDILSDTGHRRTCSQVEIRKRKIKYEECEVKELFNKKRTTSRTSMAREEIQSRPKSYFHSFALVYVIYFENILLDVPSSLATFET